MTLPVQITFNGIDRSDAVEARIKERVERLSRFADDATGLEVRISAPHHHNGGSLFQFTLELRVPRSDIIVRQADTSNHAHKDIYVALRDAFDALERRTHERNARQGR